MESLQDGQDTRDPNGYEDIVTAARFGNIKDKSQIKWESNSGQRRFFTCDKTRNASMMVQSIKDGEIVIPDELESGGDDSPQTKFIRQMTAPYKVLKTTPTGSKKVRIATDDGRNDDAFDSMTYLAVGWKEVGQRSFYTGVSTQSRSGYA
jgi:hypothetical protein